MLGSCSPPDIRTVKPGPPEALSGLDGLATPFKRFGGTSSSEKSSSELVESAHRLLATRSTIDGITAQSSRSKSKSHERIPLGDSSKKSNSLIALQSYLSQNFL